MSQKTYLLISFILSMVFSGPALGWTPIDEPEYNLSFELNSEGEQINCSTRVGCGEEWDVNYVSLCGVMAWKENDVDWPVVEIQCHDPILGGGDDCMCKDAEWSIPEGFGHVDLTLGQFGSTADQNLIVWQTLDPAYDANVIIKADHEYRISFESFIWQSPTLIVYLYYGDIGDSNSLDPDVNVITELDVDVGIDSDNWDAVTLSFRAEDGQPYIGEPLGIRFFQTESGWYWIDGLQVEYRDLASAREPNPENEARYVSRNVSMSWASGIYVANEDGHEVYFGTSWSDVNDANKFDMTNIFRGAYDTNSYTPDEIPLELGRTYYWRVDEVNEYYVPGPIPIPPDHRWKGPIWSFTVEGHAANPSPEDEAEDESIYAILSWTPGTDSESHDVYFGTDFNEVSDANDSDPNVFKGTQVYGANSYDPPGMLDLGQTYYWRIDELREDGGTKVIKGYIWSFTVAEFLMIDDMESYVKYINDIFLTWEEEGDSTAQIRLEAGDANYIRGDQSMKYVFENSDDPYYAEASRTFSPAQDWTASGFKALTLYFRADMTNEASAVQPMYVFVSDGVHAGTVEYDDPNDLIRGRVGWQEWNIELQDFNDAGVELTNVTEMGIVIGDGNEAGDGHVYVDDIRLYPSRCVPAYAYRAGSFRYLDRYSATGDFIPDCKTDYYDLFSLASDWLVSGIGSVTASAPSDANLIGHWTMDDDLISGSEKSVVLDISGNDNHGLLYDDVSGERPALGATGNHSIAGVNDLALEFDGEDDFVEIPALNLNSNTVTISAWVKPDGIQPIYTGIVSYNDVNEAMLCFGTVSEYAPVTWIGNNELCYFWTGWAWDFHPELIVPDNQWAFVALTVEPTKGTLYLYDGITMSCSVNYESHVVRTFSDVSQFGGKRGGFRGLMDDVHIYNRALSPAEVLGLAGLSGSHDLGLEGWRADADDNDEVDFKDFAIMGDNWLQEFLWP